MCIVWWFYDENCEDTNPNPVGSRIEMIVIPPTHNLAVADPGIVVIRNEGVGGGWFGCCETGCFQHLWHTLRSCMKMRVTLWKPNLLLENFPLNISIVWWQRIQFLISLFLTCIKNIP
jgi:hypothetical protein